MGEDAAFRAESVAIWLEDPAFAELVRVHQELQVFAAELRDLAHECHDRGDQDVGDEFEGYSERIEKILRGTN